MTADILRAKFLDFFKSKKHKIVESDSLVPAGDPTVLFTPAGMNQFKKQFLGQITDFTRAASSQRCLRTDDLEKVGKTPVHHTFFEMLGNFSFGDYFKKEAIFWAWEFLTKELKIDPDKLWVSVYKDDAEAYEIWRDIAKVPENKIIKLGDKDNFWPAEAKTNGPNGPCGPCSEIFFDTSTSLSVNPERATASRRIDFGSDTGCSNKDCKPGCNCGRFAEIWNLVFTQFNRKDDGTLEPLPKKNIDTGMGLERLAAVIQGKRNNFETELFQPIIKEIERSTARSPNAEIMYAIADHIRAIVFSIYDGVMPSNESRGYVIRKLIRKSALHLQALGIKGPFLYKLVPVLAGIMEVPYPELKDRQENIAEIILAEEKSFISVLGSSDNLLNEKFLKVSGKADPEKAGVIAFELYDTYGIPFELTKGWLDKNKIKISFESFNHELEKQKNRSKSQSAMKGDVFSVKELHLGTKATKFSGYKKYAVKAKILKIINGHTQLKKAAKGEEVKIILDETCFYAESGGQVTDTGIFIKGKNIFEVLDTQKFDKVIVHSGIIREGSFKAGDEIKAQVNFERRMSIARNHTATHLLQAALRKILGSHVKQQGSLVAEDRLRFDFTHFKDVDGQDLARIEEEVNNYILDNYSLQAKEMALAQAKKTGALAFFAEKYAEEVRVVAIGGFSKEFCGGTHLDSTGQIGLFKIIHEGSVASGIRRIEAVTGKAAYGIVKNQEDSLKSVADLLGVAEDKVGIELQKKIAQLKVLEKQLYTHQTNNLTNSADQLIKNAENIKNIRVIAQELDGLNMDLLRKTVDLIKQKGDNTIIVLGSKLDGRALLVVGITLDLCNKGVNAAALIRSVAACVGGSGGGRPDFAQAGGNHPENFSAAFQELKKNINNLLI